MIRRAACTILAGLAGVMVLSAATAAAQDDTVLSLAPEALSLGAEPSLLDVQVDGAPLVSAYEFELSFDSSVVAVTAIEDGGFLSATGGTVEFVPQFGANGTLIVRAEVSGLAAGDELPSGYGSLARVTLAPLAAGGPSPLGLARASLTGENGEAVAIGRTVGGEVTVVQTPPESVQTEAVAQATALAASLPTGGGTSLIPEMPDIGGASAEIIWMGLFVLAVAVAGAGWLIGRRPTGP
jgi:hypothetical protein